MPGLRSWFSAIASMAACALLALPTTASADCGDYLETGMKSHKGTPSQSPAAPCNGPHCRKAPAPLAPVGHVVPAVMPSWDALLAEALHDLVPSFDGWLDASQPLKKLYIPSSLFRPPRSTDSN